MRILGIDYGDARVGIAVSDLLGFMAQGVRTIKNRGTEKLLTELKEILDEYKPEERHSSVGAARFLNETNTRGKKRKDVLDTVAACIILDGYLSSQKNK